LMLYHLHHRLHYEYEAPAELESQVLRLRPREDGTQRLLEHHLTVSPDPSLLSKEIDEHGNVVSRAWFLGPTRHLTVESRSVVETLRVNPFDFLIEQAWMDLPWDGALAKERPALAPCLPPVKDLGLVGFAEGVLKDAGGKVLPFLVRLNKWLHERLAKETRLEGPPRNPAETILLGRGACRDLAVAFMSLVRSQGIPARFVTGYHEGDTPSGRKDLHAWAEVFLPGGGWRGFDPSVGLAVGDRHIVLAAAPEPLAASVVTGTFISPKFGSKLEAEVLFLNETA